MTKIHMYMYMYIHVYTVKTAFYNLCGQRPRAWPKFHARSLCTEKSLWWATTCQTRKHDQRQPDFACTDPFTCKCTWEWDHSRVHINLVIGLCRLRTTFCVNFEQQRFKLLVFTAASACDCSENAFCLEFEEKKSVDFPWASPWASLSNPRFTDHLLFETVFCCTNGWS